NNLLITSRHHGTKNHLTGLLRDKSFTCFEEVYAIDSEGRSRFSGIIAFQPNSKNAFIIDSTIRYESNDANQDQSIQEEKESIYSKCIKMQKNIQKPLVNGTGKSEGYGLEAAEHLGKV